MSNSVPLRPARNPLIAVTQPGGKPIALNDVPAQLVQKAAMFNTVLVCLSGFYGAFFSKLYSSIKVETATGPHHPPLLAEKYVENTSV